MSNLERALEVKKEGERLTETFIRFRKQFLILTILSTAFFICLLLLTVGAICTFNLKGTFFSLSLPATLIIALLCLNHRDNCSLQIIQLAHGQRELQVLIDEIQAVQFIRENITEG